MPGVICSFCRHLSTSLLTALSIAVILWLGHSVLCLLESDFVAIGVNLRTTGFLRRASSRGSNFDDQRRTRSRAGFSRAGSCTETSLDVSVIGQRPARECVSGQGM